MIIFVATGTSSELGHLSVAVTFASRASCVDLHGRHRNVARPQRLRSLFLSWGTTVMLKLVIAAAAAMSLCACATITRGTTQAFEVRTSPPGAEVQTSTGLWCKSTPCVFPNVARNSNFVVTITKPGYKTIQTNITNENKGGGTANLAGNILVGGLIGIGVDASSGALQDLTPNPLEVALELEAAPAPTAAPVAATPASAGAAGS